MGGRTATTDDLWARAKANGYQEGAHTEIDEIRGRGKYVTKTEKDHDRTLRRYIQWRLGTTREDHKRKGLPPPDEDATRGHCLGVGIPAPDLVTVKDFLRFYIATSHPQLDKKVPTADAICTVGEWFFAGFTRVTGTETVAKDRSEVYYWVRRTLTKEGVVVNKHRPKHNFTVRDLTRVLLALWTFDDLIFIHERHRVQATFLIHVYCWTGARIDTFFKGGLRYKDIDLILQRENGSVDGRDWRLVYKIDERWVKNNRDPENVVFGAAAKEHKRLFYNDAGFLLAMAIADGALFGYDTLNDFRQQVIPEGKDQVILRFKDSSLNRPILRKCTKVGGVTDEPMSKSAFLDILRSTLTNAGYFCGASIHAIRRQLGKEVDQRHTAVERSQHLTQADPRVFGQSYVANCSSVDGQAAFRHEEGDQRHIEYFQSLEKFHEDGLPNKLPAHLEEELKPDPQLCQLEAEVQALMGGMGAMGDNQAFSTAKRRLTTYSRRLKRDALRLYQETWVRERRDWKILTRGKEVAQDHSKTELAQDIYKLFPERGRLAVRMASTQPLTPDDMWHALGDLQALCLHDSNVLYLPGSRPVDGACPVKACQRQMNSLPKSQRNQHIQNCLRREMVTGLARLVSDVHYCYHCFDWFVGDGWEAHCQTHLDDLTTKRCGSVIHCHTLVRPAYCPICIGNVSLSPSERLRPWSRDHKLWVHVNEEHLMGCQWPLGCLHPLCNSTSQDHAGFQYHLMDAHKFSRSRPATVMKSRANVISDQELSPGEGVEGAQPCRKRKLAGDPSAVKWQRPESLDSIAVALEERPSRCPFKRQPPNPLPLSICPAAILIDDDTSTDNTSGSATASTANSSSTPFGIEDDEALPDLEWGVSRSALTNLHGNALSLGPTNSDDGSDIDTLFKQYLRSPLSSPPPPASPDDAGSELSGDTLVVADHDQPCGAPPLYVDSLSRTTPNDVPGCQVAGDPADADRGVSGPRIRLRVSPPKITLRLRLHGTSQPGKKGKAAKKKTDKKGGTRKGNGRKTGNRPSKKR